jgi:hypothetical protein
LGIVCRDDLNKAIGMLDDQLRIDPADALARIRAHAYLSGRTATDIAHDIRTRA